MLSVPTFQTTPLNRARNASEALYPHLWRDLLINLQPGLGPTGDVLHDLSGHGSNGALTDMVPADDWVLDEGRFALEFDGVNDFVTCPYIVPVGAFSISFWLRTTDSSTGVLQTSESPVPLGAARDRHFFLFADGTILFHIIAIAGNGRAISTTVVNDGEWHYIVGTIDTVLGNSIYIDGILEDNNALGTNGFSTYNTPNLLLGFADSIEWDSGYLACSMDDISLYSRTLRSSELQLRHQLGRGGWMARRRRVFAKAPAAPSGVSVGRHYPRGVGRGIGRGVAV